MAHFSNSGVAYPSHGYQSQSSPVNGQKSRRQPAPFQDVEESAIASVFFISAQHRPR
ncbi:hypothetical protein PHLCEN_2v7572 [Hermanssonia centrifuga]|uniref:Uncharacterized protein n=1 Tax=Hermanssonia centrifuga TaxID=98765 RepID=A0A2R6NW64_9APHY|nr:hypothetical protein PHLCEN_2v7572 [Hermanssonia centrifuga]